MTPLRTTLPAFRDVTEEPWYATYDNVRILCRWLVHHEGYNANELLGVIDKPWNWTDEWSEYQKGATT